MLLSRFVSQFHIFDIIFRRFIPENLLTISLQDNKQAFKIQKFYLSDIGSLFTFDVKSDEMCCYNVVSF